MNKRRTRKQKALAKRNDKKVVPKQPSFDHGTAMFKADLTKSLWLTMLAVGVEVALWYLWKPGY